MEQKLDFKKEYRDLYQPGPAPALVEVPPIPYLMVDGQGAPDGQAYQNTIELLYAVSMTIKMSKMNGTQPAGYFEYVVPPLEGLWDCGPQGFAPDRESWRWTSMIRQPEFVTQEVVRQAVDRVRQKHPDFQLERIRLGVYEEGLCVQAMHLGPYTTEQETIDKITAFVQENALSDMCGAARRHHEIYLSDPRRVPPERLKTVLRHPVSRK
ncbi:MAG: GyrI-like domain-containing protein [Oscillospiraceae bacterium]